MRAARSVWISDIHLGTTDCQVDPLLEFLRQVECEHLFLVGDIIDVWAMKKLWYWPTSHSVVIQKLLRMARKGVRMTYLPGNHDAAARAFCGHALGRVRIENEVVYTALDGRQWLVIHGDTYDNLFRSTASGHEMFAWITAGLSLASRLINRVNGWFGWGHTSLIDRVVHGFGSLVDNHAAFVKNAVADVRERRLDGVICGHIHTPDIYMQEGVTYMNCGDWTGSCTAIVEWPDGSFEIVKLGAPSRSPFSP